MIREINVGKETLIYFIFGKRIADIFVKTTETPIVILSILAFHVCVILVNAIYFIELGVFFSFNVVIILSVLSSVLIIFVTAARASPSILFRVMKTTTFHLRLLLVLIFGLTTSDVIAFDDRVLIVVLVSFIFLSAVIAHDILIENSLWVRNLFFITAILVSFLSVIILQFDLLSRRRTTIFDWLNINGFIYNWSTYQTALESSYSIAVLFLKQGLQLMKTSSEHYLFLSDPVYVKIIPFEINLDIKEIVSSGGSSSIPQSPPIMTNRKAATNKNVSDIDERITSEQTQTPNDLERSEQSVFVQVATSTDATISNYDQEQTLTVLKPGNRIEDISQEYISCDVKRLFVKGNVLATIGEGNKVEYVTRVILHEDDCLLAHIIGNENAREYFLFLGRQPIIRAIISLLATAGIVFGIILLTVSNAPIGLSYPGLLLPLIGIGQKFCYKSLDMLKLITFRTDFIIDFLFVLVVVGALCIELGNQRIVAALVIIFAFLDERTVDSQVIFMDNPRFTPTTVQKRYCFEKICVTIFHTTLTLTTLSCAIVIAAGLVVNGNINAVIQFRPIDNSSTQVPPSGTFANLEMSQLGSNGLSFFVMIYGIYTFERYFDALLSKLVFPRLPLIINFKRYQKSLKNSNKGVIFSSN